MELKPSDENYTPESIIKPCRDFLGGFDLDPFSCEAANKIIQAKTFWDASQDAFKQDWSRYKRKWINPPYSREIIANAASIAIQYSSNGETLLLVNTSSSANWYQECLKRCDAVLFPHKRINFISPYREGKASNRYDQSLFYFGKRSSAFYGAVKDLGSVLFNEF